MGDRTTPMKFGPEWLRNLSREPTSPGASGGAQAAVPIRPVTTIATASSSTTTQPNTSKVLLAKLRYGREEMLALYDRQTAESPPQLRSIELLYQPRGKPPYALNNNFEDDTRDSNMRNNPPTIGAMSISDRYGQGRGRGLNPDGRGRATTVTEARGRARGFTRQTSLGSDTFRSPNWHNGQRVYPGAPDDDPNPGRGLWNNGNGMTPPGIRPSSEQADWANKMPFRKNRQNHTNWRQQPNREEGEEWRSSEGARRGQEKWEREWPERNNQEKPWTPNRRQWGGDNNNEDSLPEWAVENSEACGGTFDASGAFHGYSNDDSNLPKTQEASYPLARSQTHGSFARSRTAEEGSEEWWASEKAKKLSAKRFDATEVKFKKHVTPGISEENAAASASTSSTNTGTLDTNTVSSTNTGQKIELLRRSASPPTHDYGQELQDEAAALPPKRDQEHKHDEDKTKDRTYYSENTQNSVQQRIDMLLRSEETADSSNERGNYKSVMMTPNNNHLRQKHQNIGIPTNDPPKRAAPLFERAKQQTMHNQSDEENQQKQQETKLVEDLLEMNLNEELQTQLLNTTTQATGLTNQISNPRMQMRMNSAMLNQGMGMNQPNPNMPSSSGMPQGSMMRPMGIPNTMLNASLGLPLAGSSMGIRPMASMTPSITNSGMLSSALQGLGGNSMQNTMQGMQTGMQSGIQLQGGMQGSGFQPGGGMPGSMQPGGITNTNLQSPSGMPGFQGVGNSLFMQGATNAVHNPNEMVMHSQQGMYPMHGHLQQTSSHTSFNPASMYGNMMQPPPSVPLPNIPLSEQWYYEDPKKTIQGPFTSKEMYNWYRAGFFNPDLMVRRACESGLRPLATYGLMPFGPMDILPPPYHQLSGRFDLRQAHENMMNAQQAGLGPEVESLWSQPTANDIMWMQQAAAARDDNSRVNNLSMYFWDQPTGMSNSLLPEAIAKEMKTEDEILAQMRASQSDPASQNLTFMTDVSPEDAFTAGTNIAPNLEELQKLIESDIHVSAAQRVTAAADAAANAAANAAADAAADAAAGVTAADASTVQRPRPPATADKEKKLEKPAKAEPISEVSAKQQGPAKPAEAKPVKQPAKAEEKPVKAKEVAIPKAKAKKQKDDKKDDAAEGKVATEEKKITEKRSEEPSPPKNKKEDKANKKDLEKEKKEWLKDGFTLVKGAEKKDSKKKEKEEARAVEEAEKKKKDEEKRALIEAEKNRTPEPVTRKQQMEIGQVRQPQSQAQPQVEPVSKKAPWSAPTAGRDGLALSDIQRLEREKKLEQMKEQQQMMQVLAQQQAAAAAALKEQQELQAGQVGWAKKKQPNSPPGQTLSEIQAEARLHAASIAAAATAAAREEARATPPPVNIAPWGATNGGGFWDSPTSTSSTLSSTEAKVETQKVAESKPKKKVTVVAPPKKEVTPAADFETWCTSVLSNWRDAATIDIPTFVAFLRDIESPYEVKDYVKCYLGDTKEATDFARQFLERRSRLLRVGMVTPSDDLCSPAVAINPRTNSGSDFTEVKSKGKKTKKNKMFKVDARILGFSVTASEDRINIGDIDSV